MKILSAFLVALLAMSVLPISDAEAKRFGGGRSLGKQFSAPRSAPSRAQKSAQSSSAKANPTRGGGASRWLGPLAGLAAGGLLASLFFGDAFEGLQAMDFLFLGALIFGGFMLFRMFRGVRSPVAAARTPVSALAYGGSFQSARQGGGDVLPDSADGDAPTAMSGEDEAPNWFDGPGFVEGAKTHFIRLQAAWDQADYRDIREYTTPQLFAELQRERQQLDRDHQFTEVVTLEAELVGVRRDADLAIASVAFSGLIREEEQGPANRFNEIWHVQHAWDKRDGEWLITGIQQVED